jgi:hypothetical protein
VGPESSEEEINAIAHMHPVFALHKR